MIYLQTMCQYFLLMLVIWMIEDEGTRDNTGTTLDSYYI